MTAPGVSVAVDLAGAKQLLTGLAGAVKDLSPVFRGPIDSLTTEAFLQQFETRGVRLNGAAWQPLTPATIALRTRVIVRKGAARTTNRVGMARAGFSAPLQNTRRLWASLVKSGGPEGLRIVTPSSYERGTRVRYAALHQTGFTVTSMFGRPLKVPKVVPARPLVPENLPNDLVGSYEAALAKFILEGSL